MLAVLAFEALTAYEDVPCNEPVIPPVTIKDPVIVWLPTKLFDPVVAKLVKLSIIVKLDPDPISILADISTAPNITALYPAGIITSFVIVCGFINTLDANVPVTCKLPEMIAEPV